MCGLRPTWRARHYFEILGCESLGFRVWGGVGGPQVYNKSIVSIKLPCSRLAIPSFSFHMPSPSQRFASIFKTRLVQGCLCEKQSSSTVSTNKSPKPSEMEGIFTGTTSSCMIMTVRIVIWLKLIDMVDFKAAVCQKPFIMQ